jgi:hypothetical protein
MANAESAIINQETAVVPVDALRPHPENPNQGDVGAIYESITENGFFGHVVVQKGTDVIIAGEHRWKAAKDAGMDEVPVVYLDVDDERARRILLTDNRTNRLGTDVAQATAALLQELACTPAGLAGTGWDGDALDELLSDLAPPEPSLSASGESAGGGVPQPQPQCCPRCGHRF